MISSLQAPLSYRMPTSCHSEVPAPKRLLCVSRRGEDEQKEGSYCNARQETLVILTLPRSCRPLCTSPHPPSPARDSPPWPISPVLSEETSETITRSRSRKRDEKSTWPSSARRHTSRRQSGKTARRHIRHDYLAQRQPRVLSRATASEDSQSLQFYFP